MKEFIRPHRARTVADIRLKSLRMSSKKSYRSRCTPRSGAVVKLVDERRSMAVIDEEIFEGEREGRKWVIVSSLLYCLMPEG